ncbi:MAG: AraC family transcriptional regulator [Parasphingorhabdus sp.]
MAHSYEKRILRVLEYIHENPAGDLSLDTLADVAAMSRFHWHRVFHAMTGETCAQAVRRVRLYRAANWLIYKDWSVAEVARRAGYPNVQSFTRTFTDAFSVSPGTFRTKGSLSDFPTRKPKGTYKMFEVEIKRTPARHIAALLHKGSYTEVGPCFDKLANIATKTKLWPNVECMVGIHYDDPNVIDEANLRCHAGLSVPGNVPVPNELELVQLQGGDYAILHYKGPYEGVKIAYDFLFGKWLAETDCIPLDAPCYELYLNNPEDTPPEQLLTDIYLPMAA